MFKDYKYAIGKNKDRNITNTINIIINVKCNFSCLTKYKDYIYFYSFLKITLNFIVVNTKIIN